MPTKRDFAMMSKLEACAWLHLHNRGVDFTYDESTRSYQIFSKVPSEEWKNLPPGWYYNEKNGFTNKHHTPSGAYDCIKVEFVRPSFFERLFGF